MRGFWALGGALSSWALGRTFSPALGGTFYLFSLCLVSRVSDPAWPHMSSACYNVFSAALCVSFLCTSCPAICKLSHDKW